MKEAVVVDLAMRANGIEELFRDDPVPGHDCCLTPTAIPWPSACTLQTSLPTVPSARIGKFRNYLSNPSRSHWLTMLPSRHGQHTPSAAPAILVASRHLRAIGFGHCAHGPLALPCRFNLPSSQDANTDRPTDRPTHPPTHTNTHHTRVRVCLPAQG